MDENMAADVLTGTDASAEGADFDGLFDMDGGEVTAEPQETEGQEGAAETQEPEAEPAEGTCADAQPGRLGRGREAAQAKPATGRPGSAAGGMEPNGDKGQQGAEPKYKVKFYGQEQEMTVSELVAAAQKGLDYDNVRARLEQAQQSAPAVQLVERYAAANGMTVEQYLQFANQGFEQQAVAQLVAQGVPEPAAKDLVAERLRLDRERRSIAPLAAQQRAQQEQREKLSPWMELLREYPGTKELPPEVAQRVAAGETPLAAMRAFELAQMRAQLAAKDAAQKNRQTAPGSAGGLGGKERKDDFEAGFDAGFDF